MFKLKTLAVLFSPYPREMKHIPRNLNLPPFLALACFYRNGAIHSHARARGLNMRTHLTAVAPAELFSGGGYIWYIYKWARYFSPVISFLVCIIESSVLDYMERRSSI